MTTERLVYRRPGLAFDEASHTYTYNGRELISVTHALLVAGFIDQTWYTDAAAGRGSRVHAAIRLHHEGSGLTPEERGDDAPYVAAYQRFLLESGYRDVVCEQMLVDPVHGCAGTVDLLGAFPQTRDDAVDLIDVKSGTIPSWVGYQTAGYRSMLPPTLARTCRRFVLNLRGDGTYALIELRGRHDEAVFHAAVLVAQARKGWVK